MVVTHPPCTPSASCTPIRCHPTPPPCLNPEKCLKKSTSKGLKPCASAVSIMSQRPKSKCEKCGRTTPSKKNKKLDKFLKRKESEAKMQRKDRITGSNTYDDYTRKRNRKRFKKKKRCEIL